MREIILRGRGPNTMTLESLRAFAATLAAHPDEPLLIYGEGDAFSAGLDLKALAAGGDPRAIIVAIEAVVVALFHHSAPTVAAVNGHAVAGGCLIAQACDLRVGASNPSIKIGMTGVALGITYPPTVLRLLRYRLLASTIDQVLLEATRHPPAEALRLGLLDVLVDDAVAEGRVRLAAMAAHPSAAYAEAKRALREGALEVSPEARERFNAMRSRTWGSAQFSPSGATVRDDG